MVSGLNDLAHSGLNKRSLLSRFKDKAFAYEKADVSDEGIAKLHENVAGLRNAYKKANSWTHTYDLEGYEYEAITENGVVNLNKMLLSEQNNLHFAGVLFHEYRHAFQYSVPYTVGGKKYSSRFSAWGKLYGHGYNGQGGKWDMMELDAYSVQYNIGDSSDYVFKRLNKYYNLMLKKWIN